MIVNERIAALVASLLLAAFVGTASAQKQPDWTEADKAKARGDRWAEEQKKRSLKIQTPGEIERAGAVATPGTMEVADDVEAPPAVTVTEDGCRRRLAVGADALFEFDKATLTPEAERTLAELGPMIRSAGGHPVVVEGHTDAVGTDAYNQTLSELRALAVTDWLVARGYLRRSAVKYLGRGERVPAAPNANADGSDNPEGRRLNRRVVVVVDLCE